MIFDMKILIAMSGGVDSSVAAEILNKNGNECIGCTMKLYDGVAQSCSSRTCCSLDDVEDARSVAYRLGMKYYVFNFTKDFQNQVINRFVESYCLGRTPNPCIDCNRYMKFDRLLKRAETLGCDKIATGHYARIEFKNGKYILKKAVDMAKDQSYVLYNLTQQQLCHTLFPLGGLNKEQTRKIAVENGFLNADKPDSQDICFIPDGDYAAFIEQTVGRAALCGEFVDKNGNFLGKHRGIIRYTVGQHRGLGGNLPRKMYVCGINAAKNQVLLGDEKELYRNGTEADDLNWISGQPPAESFKCSVRMRYHGPEAAALVTLRGNTAQIEFETPQKSPTPGQAAVFYDGDIVLGGGIIKSENSRT